MHMASGGELGAAAILQIYIFEVDPLSSLTGTVAVSIPTVICAYNEQSEWLCAST